MKRLVALVMVLAVVVAGCTKAGQAGPVPSSVASASSSASPADLVAMRRSAGIPDCPASTTLPAVKGGLPDVELACLGGGPTMRLGGLRGPMIVNFWAQWCQPCRAESPHLREFLGLAKGKVTLLGIDGNDPREDYAVEFAGLVGWRYVQLYDPDKISLSPLGLNSLPHSMFIDANGVIVYHHVGAFGSTEQIRTLAAQYLQVSV